MKIIKQLQSLAIVFGLGMAAMAPAAAEYRPGDVVGGDVTLLGKTIPLPWSGMEVAFFKEYTISAGSDGRYKWEQVILVRHDGGVVRNVVGVKYSTNPKRRGYVKFPACKHKDYYVSETEANRRGKSQDCWHVYTMEVESSWEGGEGLIDYAKSKGLIVPLTFVGPRYHFASKGAFLNMDYGLSPDTLLPAGNDKGYWTYSDLMPDAITARADLKALYETITDWAKKQYPLAKQTFTQ